MSTQWAAQFLVAAELERHEYAVSFTMGNQTPVADLMVGHSNGKQFWVDVKGIAGRNSWWGLPKAERLNLFYILVSVGGHRREDRFFILNQTEWNGLITQYQMDHPTQKKKGGFGWVAPHVFEDQWSKLPGWQVNSN
jgi:hypothetical protein